MSESHELQIQRHKTLSDWRSQEKSALELLKIVGDLRFDQGVELVLFRRDIYDSRPSEVLHHHKLATDYISRPVSISTTLKIASEIQSKTNLMFLNSSINAWRKWLGIPAKR
jgi:glyceraldehyde 3-phosphate dehydrogenase